MLTVFLLATASLAAGIAIFSSWRAARLVDAFSKQVSASLQRTKRLNDIEAEMSELNSSFETLLASHKRLRSREGMANLRDRRKGSDRPETKAELLQRLGLAGKTGPDFARAQLSLNANDSD